MAEHSPHLRPKRLRLTAGIRSMVRETHLHISNLIAPLFISETAETKQAILSMPEHYQLPLTALEAEIIELQSLGIPAVLLFGIPAEKDEMGSSSLSASGIIQQAIRLIRNIAPEMVIIADVCLCEYTDHGHCGVLQDDFIDNDRTLDLLAEQAVSYAEAGAHWVAPSSMTDGMVYAIRDALDRSGYQEVAILSYAVKYSSSFYGPFREAAMGAPQFGDRKSYQMDPANGEEAIREAAIDLDEGTDLLMVKPAIHYLDVIYRLKTHFPETPICAYHVSGEYAMLKAAAEKGWIEEEAAMLESLIAIKRAGANLIVTYYAKAAAKALR